MADTIKCSKCKDNKPIDDFTIDGQIVSYCKSCREYNVQKGLRNRCAVCGIWASYNTPGVKFGKYCAKHALVGMIDVKSKMCTVCNVKQPTFNLPDSKTATHCADCRLVGMIDVKSKMCIVCKIKQPAFNTPGNKIGTHCGDCRLPNMIDVKHPKCIVCNVKIPIFNTPGSKTATHCASCRLVGMINVINKMCTVCNVKQPTFNTPGSKTATHCSDCLLPDMINVKSKMCTVCNIKIPTFNNPGSKTGTHCASCRLVGMIDVKSKMCTVCNVKRPTFNLPGSKMATHCSNCRLPGMIDVKHEMCTVCNIKIPNFNLPGSKTATHCASCRLPDMINVKSKRCTVDNCTKRANYGYCGQSPTFCATHRDKSADKKFIYIKPKRVCEHAGANCLDVAEWGKNEPKYCYAHKTEGDFHLVAQKCQQCCRNDILKDGLCVTYCAIGTIFAEKKKREKAREAATLKYLDEKVTLKGLIGSRDDTIVDTVCNKYRPDRIYDLGTHCVIVEIDEDQHKGKRASCAKGEIGELARMHEIQNAVGVHCIFLRFNPDGFKVGNKKIKLPIGERLATLVRWVNHCASMRPERDLQPVRYKYLFYDDYDGANLDFLEVDDTLLYDK